MKLGKTVKTGLIMSALLAALCGCQKQDDSAQRAGKEVDNAVKRAGNELNHATEQVGQQIEKAGKNIKDSAKGDK